VVVFDTPTNEHICSASLRGHTDPVWSVCFSPCGEKIASGGGNEYGNKDYSIRIWDAKTGEQIGSPLRAHKNQVNAVAWSPCGRWLASGGSDDMVYVYDPKTFEVKSSVRVDSAVLSVAYSADGTKLAAGLDYPSYSVVVFNTQTNEQICFLRGHSKDNEECTCKHRNLVGRSARGDYTANPDCPVRGHGYVLFPIFFDF
jgi:WD40 repeat protein